eukprot:1294483-Alexandrium_andersonii.AAC.1
MSASLVGSEMCIRDRAFSWLRKSCSAPWAVLVTGSDGSTQTFAGPARCPVSYTHLTLPTICSV